MNREKNREVKVSRKGVDTKLESLSNEAYTKLLQSLLMKAYTNVSAMQSEREGNAKRDVIYLFQEKFHPESRLYTLTVIVKAAEYEEGVGISEHRVKAKSKMGRHLLDAKRACLEALLLSHIDTSLIVWEQTMKMLAANPDMQKAVSDLNS